MSDDRTLRVRIQADVANYRQGLQQASAATGEFAKNVSGMGTAVSADVERVGRSALVMSAGLTAGLGLSVKAAIDWETAWVGVRKVIEGSPEEVAHLEGELRKLATTLPATHGEIAATAQAAGQLGIAREDIAAFTEVMIALGETTNLTADQAAISIARMTNIMGTSNADVERLGSVIVDLGNNSATTEAEIVELATRLAAAGRIAGLTEADVLAFSATLTSVGVEAQAGGTALSKVFIAIRDSVLTGNDSLQVFADTAGMTVDQFKEAFERDAATAIAAFVNGLGRINAAGESTTAIFAELSLTDQRLMRALLSTASAGDLLTDSLEMGARAWDENVALANEAELRYGSTAAQMQVFRNQMNDLAIDAGQVLLPALNATVGVLGDMATGFSMLPGPLMTAGVALTGVAAAGLGVIGVVGIMGPKVVAAQASLMNMGAAGQFVGRNMGNAAKGVGAFTLGLAALSLYEGMMAKAATSAAAFGSEVRAALDSADTYEALAHNLEVVEDAITDLYNTAASSKAPWDHDYRAELRMGAKELEGLADEYGPLIARMDELADRTGITKDQALALIREQDRLALSANSSAEQVRGLTDSMSPEEVQRLAAELGVTTDQLDGMTGAGFQSIDMLDSLAGAMRMLADVPMSRIEAELDLADAIDAVADAQRAMNGETAKGATVAQTAADTARKLEMANRRVADSQRAVADAEELVADKREKLRQIMEGFGEGSEEAVTAEERAAKATRDAERAELALADARKRLNDPRLSRSDRRSAELDLADAQDRVRDTARAAEKARTELSDALTGADPASKKAQDAAKELDNAERTLEGALRSQEDALRAVDEAASNRGRNMSGGQGIVRTQAQLERDLERAMLSLERKYREVAEVETENRVALEEANGVTLTATQRQEIYAEELGKVAETLDPGSPLRKNLQDYIDTLLDIPGSISTTIDIEPSGPVTGVWAPEDHPGGQRATIRGIIDQRIYGGRAAGGPVNAGETYVVGENGPELLQMGGNGFITPNDRLTDLVSAPAGMSSSTDQSTTFSVGEIKVTQAPGEDAGRSVMRGLRQFAWEHSGVLV